MSAAAFTIDYDRAAWRRARERVEVLAERSQNVRPAWNVFLDWFAHGNRQQFGSHGMRWGTQWRELSPDYLNWKREEGWQGDILVRTSDLLRSVADRPLMVERLGTREMHAGTRLDYAKHHHYGAPRRGLPRRPLWSARNIRRSGAATSAVRTWIVHGNARVSAGIVT